MFLCENFLEYVASLHVSFARTACVVDMLICRACFTLFFIQPLFFVCIYCENNAGLRLVRPLKEDRFAYPAKIKERLMNLVCVGLVTYAKLCKAVALSSSAF